MISQFRKQFSLFYLIKPKKKPFGNTQKGSIKIFFAGPNTQLQGNNKNNTLAPVFSIKNNLNIDIIKKIIKIPTIKGSTLIKH